MPFLVSVLRSDSLCLLTCIAVQRLPVRLLGRLYLCACWGVFYLCLVLSICVLQISVQMRHVMFADSYLAANMESWNKACTLGKYYSYIEVIFAYVRIYKYTLHHVLAVALASLP